MSDIKLIQFPKTDIADVAQGLRNLAESVEAGELGDAHNIAWVCDCGDGRIETGLLGQAALSGIEAHWLFTLGARNITNAKD